MIKSIKESDEDCDKYWDTNRLMNYLLFIKKTYLHFRTKRETFYLIYRWISRYYESKYILNVYLCQVNSIKCNEAAFSLEISSSTVNIVKRNFIFDCHGCSNTVSSYQYKVMEKIISF